ncbi:MAG TPA: hypothetical protein VKS24_11015 [Bradyrhizobium sp.]|nr:hypothetical protein [Bradyrhizobium sp.]
MSYRLDEMQAAQTVTLRVRAKQNLAPPIKGAFARYEAWIEVASIVERGVPSTALPPFAPGYVIAILAVGISWLSGRAKDALAGVAYGPGQCGPRQHAKNDCGSANQSECRHAFLPVVLVAIKYRRESRICFLKEN